MENLGYLFILLVLGKGSQRISIFPENTSHVLNQFVIYISFPATILLKINGIEIQSSVMVLAVVPWVLVLFSIFAVGMASKFFQWDRQLTGTVLLCVALGNTAFIGLPAVSAVFGDDSLGYAIIYDQLGSFMTLATFGTIVVSIFGTSQKVSFKRVMAKIFGFPPFIALLTGLVLMKTDYPETITTILDRLSVTLVPLVIFSIGAQLKFRQPISNVKPICIAIFLKTILSPLIAFLLLRGIGINGSALHVSVFQAGMPTMVMVGVLCATGNLKANVANAVIGYGIIFSFITLPVVYYLLMMMM